MFTLSALSTLVLLGLLSARSGAHSWNEQLSLIAENGSFVANGYPRGYVARTDPAFGSDNTMTWRLPSGRSNIDDQDLLCNTLQRNSNQSPNYPRLAVTHGSAIAMKYLENGHVTLPNTQLGKQAKGGTVFIFGTTQPSPAETLSGVLKWTVDGSGGDKRGKLLQAQNFDDGRCYQINDQSQISQDRQNQYPNPIPGQVGGHNEQWCESNVIIPADAPVGKSYTLYWVWQWPTQPNIDPGIPNGKDEYYTTCSDVDVMDQLPQTSRFSNILKQQDPQMDAVKDYKSRSALFPTPLPQGIAGLGSTSSPSSTSASLTSKTLAEPSASAAPSHTSVAASSQVGLVMTVSGAPPFVNHQAAQPNSMVVPLAISAFTVSEHAQPTAKSPVAANAGTAAPATTRLPPVAVTTSRNSTLLVPAGMSSMSGVIDGSTVPIGKRAAPTVIASNTVHHHAQLHSRNQRGVGSKHGRWFRT